MTHPDPGSPGVMTESAQFTSLKFEFRSLNKKKMPKLYYKTN